jgi:hypothetical protein
VRVRELRRLDDGGVVDRAEPGDVLGDRAGEQLDVLRQVADVRAELVAVPLGDVGAVEAHRSRLRLPDAEHEPRQRRLARRARADEAEAFAGVERERGALDQRRAAGLVAEDDALDLQLAARRRAATRRRSRSRCGAPRGGATRRARRGAASSR